MHGWAWHGAACRPSAQGEAAKGLNLSAVLPFLFLWHAGAETRGGRDTWSAFTVEEEGWAGE